MEFRGFASFTPCPGPIISDYTRRTRFEVGLVPCLDTRFNQRDPKKAPRCSRMMGAYSPMPAYSGVVKNGINGVLLTNSPVANGLKRSSSCWIPDRRRELLEGMRRGRTKGNGD